MPRNIFESQIDTLVIEIVNAHARCNPHAKHMHMMKLCKYMKNVYLFLKRKHEQKNIDEMSKCYFRIQYADKVIKKIYDILDEDVIQEYEIYRDSVKQSIIKDIDFWIESTFNYRPFYIHT